MMSSDSSHDQHRAVEAAPFAGRKKLPYGTLRIPERDELASSTTISRAIKSADGRYHRLSIQHAELGDDKVQNVFQELQTPSNTLERVDQGAVAFVDSMIDQDSCSEWLQFLQSHLRALGTHRLMYHGFRIIELDNNDLTSDCLPAICSFLKGNLSLHTLSLKANKIDGSNDALPRLAEAVGQSSLRNLCLSNNPISLESLASFIDSIPASGTALEQLQLSQLYGSSTDDSASVERQAALAADSIADFLADSQRCRSLYALSLNGNNLGSRGVLTIISAVIGSGGSIFLEIEDLKGSRHDISDPLAELAGDPFFNAVLRSTPRRSNMCLGKLEIHGNMAQGWRPVDPQNERERLVAIKQRYASIPLDDTEAIVTFLLSRARKHRLRGRVEVDREAPIEVTRHLTTIGITLDEWEADFKAAFEFGTGVNLANWPDVLGAHLVYNFIDAGSRCRRAALCVLRAARTLGCRARRQISPSMSTRSRAWSESAGFPKFLDLPPEIRLHVLRQLDSNGHLSARQFGNVVSFACEPSTIGYGRPEYDWSQILDGEKELVDGSGSSSYATLPARRWSWAECFELRAPPRDWNADQLDKGDPLLPHQTKDEGENVEKAVAYAFLESTLTHRPDPR